MAIGGVEEEGGRKLGGFVAGGCREWSVPLHISMGACRCADCAM